MHTTITTGRRLVPLAAAALATAVFAGPARAQSAPPIAVDAAHDAVTVNGLGFGQATLQVTRPDAVTGKPVVIGHYSALAFPNVAFTVNKTAPSALLPNGDCWQAGGLSLPNRQGLVPDILPGDTVSVADKSVTVPSEGFDFESTTGGPIKGCDSITMWGRNMVTGASFASPGSDLMVTGMAQPLATGVQVMATDGANSSTPVDATMTGNGSWSATLPASAFANLSDGMIKVNGIYAVPDVATGSAAHVMGRPMSVDKETPPATPQPALPGPDVPVIQPIKLSGMRLPSKISLRSARSGKLKVSFIVPTDAEYVRVRLSRPGRTMLLMIKAAGRPGSRQTVRLTGPRLRKLTAGRYTVTVGAGPTRMQIAHPFLRDTVRIK